MINIALIVVLAAGYAWLPRVQENLWNIAPAAASLLLMGRLIREPRAWWRTLLWTILLFAAAEFTARCGGYHRTVKYERQGDLLFTPAPNQSCLEKISLTPSRINNYGLRGPDISSNDLRRRVVLCLGDSITYGYGVRDEDTWPARLQRALDASRSGEFLVLNGGVNAYPVSFMRQKFLYLWNRGIHPETVVVSYSMNEGWLGDLVDSDTARKDAFERRVRLKNFLRSHALYNLVVENWGRAYYDRVKERLVPGTHDVDKSPGDALVRYEKDVAELLDDVSRHGSKAVVLVLGSFDAATGRYDTQGPLQEALIGAAAARGLPCVRSDNVLQTGAAEFRAHDFFIDVSHMTPTGNAAVARAIAETLL